MSNRVPRSPKTRRRSWETYEQVACFLLNRIAGELGLSSVERKQRVRGTRSTATWEIDAKGVSEGGVGFFLVEARRWEKRRLTQEHVASIALRVHDTRAGGGIVVSPLGLQCGARKVAAAYGVTSVQLNANATTTEFMLRFLNRVMLSQAPDRLSIGVAIPLHGTLETVVFNARPREA